MRRSGGHSMRPVAVRRRCTEVVPHLLPSVPLWTEGIYIMDKEIYLMSIGEAAVQCHDKGYNCCQSVLYSCKDCIDLDEKALLAVSGGFGGGVRCGEICGAVTGGVMAIGLCKPYTDHTDLYAKNRIADLTREFIARFNSKYGCIRCDDLKAGGCVCNELIAFCAQQAEDIINNSQEK